MSRRRCMAAMVRAQSARRASIDVSAPARSWCGSPPRELLDQLQSDVRSFDHPMSSIGHVAIPAFSQPLPGACIIRCALLDMASRAASIFVVRHARRLQDAHAFVVLLHAAGVLEEPRAVAQ